MLAKSKLNSIETLTSQALINLDITHEKFKTIVNEKEKYETWKQNGVEVIVSNGKKCLNGKHIQEQLKLSNLPAGTLQYSSELRKQRQELQNCGKYQPCRRFLEEAFAKQIIMDCRTTPAVNFKAKLGFSQHDPIMTQEQLILPKIIAVLAAEEIIMQHNVLGYRIDAYLPKHNLAIEVDEQRDNDRDIDYEIERTWFKIFKTIHNKKVVSSIIKQTC